MSTFVEFMFWYLVVLVFMKTIVIVCSDYPRTVKFNVGVDVVSLLSIIAIMVWAGILRA